MNESFEMEFTLDKIIFQKNDFKIVRVKVQLKKFVNTLILHGAMYQSKVKCLC